MTQAQVARASATAKTDRIEGWYAARPPPRSRGVDWSPRSLPMTWEPLLGERNRPGGAQLLHAVEPSAEALEAIVVGSTRFRASHRVREGNVDLLDEFSRGCGALLDRARPFPRSASCGAASKGSLRKRGGNYRPCTREHPIRPPPARHPGIHGTRLRSIRLQEKVVGRPCPFEGGEFARRAIPRAGGLRCGR